MARFPSSRYLDMAKRTYGAVKQGPVLLQCKLLYKTSSGKPVLPPQFSRLVVNRDLLGVCRCGLLPISLS